MTSRRLWSIGLAVALAMSGATALAQSPTPREQQTPPPARGGRAGGGGRAALPAVTANMTPGEVQTLIDGYALVQSTKELQLTAEQEPGFIARLRKLQNLRRQHQIERRKLLNELSGLLQGQGSDTSKDEAIVAHVKALDDLQQRAATEVQQAYQAIDAVLTPWQRGRYRMFEEQLERRKVEWLAKVNGGGGAAPVPK